MTPFVLLLLAQTQVFVWTDKEGVEHYTDDPRLVPRGAKVKLTGGAEISSIEGAPPRPQVVATTPVPPTAPAAPSAAEETWRRLFREAKRRVVELEEEIEADRKSVEEVNGLPVTGRFSCAPLYGPQPVIVINGVSQLAPSCAWVTNPEVERVRERLAKNRRELPRAKEELADLERRASFEAVPLHWRR